MNFYDFKERILDGETIYFELSRPDPGSPGWHRYIYRKYGGEIIRADSLSVLAYDPTDRTVIINMGDNMGDDVYWVPT